MSTDNDDTDDGKKKTIPDQLIPFIGITTASPEQLLYVEENGNVIRSSLTPQNTMSGMDWTKAQQQYWKTHHHGHVSVDWLSDLIDYISDEFMPFLRSGAAAGYEAINSSSSKFFNY